MFIVYHFIHIMFRIIGLRIVNIKDGINQLNDLDSRDYQSALYQI
jgi:hypothetical protein